MTDKLLYKEFIGTVHFSAKDLIFYGTIEGINDLVTFEGETVKKLKKAFEESVDDYIDLCNEVGKDPLKSFKGSFNVRIAPELHSKAFKSATMKGKSLNQFVQEAIEKEVSSL
jgi:predicted HicB family RNase H-like nuclease